MPHLLAALLTPTHAPHARLPKHWKGELSHRRWSNTRFLVASLALCFFSPHFFSSVSLSLQNVPLSLFPHFFISQNVSPHRTSLLTERLFSQNEPLSLIFLISQNVSPHRTSSRFFSLVFISPGHLHGVPSAPSSPGHGYHNDPGVGRVSELAKECC